MTPKIALCMIVKGTPDEALLLANCLKSVADHVDGIFLDLNAPKGQKVHKKILDVAKKYGAEYKETVWTGNFVTARNDNFARVPADYTHILWLDSDDTVEHPEKIRDVAAVMEDNVDGLYIKYDYAHDEYNNVVVTHWVARLVKNNNSYMWKSSFADSEFTVHETLNERRKVGKAANEEFKIIHHSTEDRMDRSLNRNIGLLEKMLAKYPKTVAPDPRILYYLATHYIDAKRLQEAEYFFNYYLKLSGWAEERSQAWVYLGMIYQAKGDDEKARGCFMRGLAENPKDPNPYVELGELELNDQLFDKAVQWLEMAVNKKPELTAIVQRPMDNTYRAYRLLAEAYANLGGSGLQRASKWLKRALELRPLDPELHLARQKIADIIDIRDLTKATNTIINKLRTDKETDKIVPLLNSLPTVLQDNPLVTSARSYYTEPVKWPRKSVAILCGWGPLGNWGPSDLTKGIGGSEEAVIQLSREMALQGYKVTVYGTPGEEAGFDGDVEYKHYWELNRKDEFDIFISWRDPSFFDKPVKARKSYLWLHDVMDKEEFIPERIANLDKVIFVSQYHRDLYKNEIPDEKSFVSGNGINAKDFEVLDGKFERDPQRIVYMSSHVRGLQLIYDVWEDVKKEVPNAKLDIYYGWSSYDSVNKNNPERMAWKEKMLQREKSLKDVKDHGRIGHDKIAEEIQKSGVWAYPCPFPEVYCITAVKAQAGGAVPVSSNFAALKETVKYGTLLEMQAQDEKTPIGDWDTKDLEAFKTALIDMLKHPEKQEAIRPEMQKWARTQTWAMRATEWIGEFDD